MVRASNAPASRKRRRRRLKQARGFYGARSKLFRTATESVDRANRMSYIHRKQKKRNYRKLWIARISAALTHHDISYSRFMEGLNKSEVGLNRKMLSEIAIFDPEGFDQLVDMAKQKATLPAKA